METFLNNCHKAEMTNLSTDDVHYKKYFNKLPGFTC